MKFTANSIPKVNRKQTAMTHPKIGAIAGLLISA